MARFSRAATTGAVVAAGRKVAGQVSARREALASSRSRRAAVRRAEPAVHVVTVNRPVGEVLVDGSVPQPLADLGDAVDVTATPAPGGRGTELRARLVHRVPSHVTLPDAGAADPATGTDVRGVPGDPREREALGQHGAVRKALRETKMLLETGEILLPDAPPTTRSTLTNAPLREAVAHGRDGGRL
jgi:hypothetical protein